MRRAIISGVLLLALAGCSDWNDDRGRGDAPVGNKDDTEADVINMPDRFANVAFKCYGTTGIYTSTRPMAFQVIKEDPNCVGNDDREIN